MNPFFRSVGRVATTLVLAVFLSLVVGCGANSNADTDVLDVSAITADPGAFTGTIAVKGVVQSVDATGSVISIIDEAEYATCGLTPCGTASILRLFLPISGKPSSSGALYTGTLPALEDVIVVIGEVKSSPEGMYFDVERIERGGKTLITKK